MADSSITPIPASLNVNFTALYAAVNAVINAIATEVVTANNSAAGATTIGNGFVVGIFGATTLITSGLRGGNSSASNTLNVVSNLAINSSSVLTLGNITVNATTVSANQFIGGFGSPFTIGNTVISDSFTQTSGTGAQIIDFFTFITYRDAEYTISVNDNVSNNKMVTKMLVIHDGATAYATEFGSLITNTAMGTFTANSNTSAVTLFFTPNSTNTNVKITRLSRTI